jgi:hypothetical protein
MDRMVNRHELTEISMLVRKPAGCPPHARSNPTMVPRTAATAILAAASQLKD